MRILVTGSEGVVGKKLVKHLQKNHDVFRCDIRQGVGNDYMVVDINNPIGLALCFKRFKPDVCYHLAAMVSRVTCEESPSLTIQTNVTGTYNVAELCREYGCKLINFSTSEIYGNIGGLLSEDRPVEPNNIYGVSKLMAEHIVEYEVTKGLKAVTVRPFMIYDEDETLGVHRSAMIRFAESLIKKEKITIHEGATRSWLHISDAVEILERLMDVNHYEAVNLCSNEYLSIEYMAMLMCEYLGLEYAEMVNIEILPDRMTLTKKPDTIKQYELTRYNPKISLLDGVKIVIDKVKKRV